MNRDEQLMLHCIEIAKEAKGNVSPNPLVGCIIAKKGKIVAAGYHREYGKPHAEAEAINNAVKNGVEIKGSTIYVNLEPCVHLGKTPPCADLIIGYKPARVVIGCKDPYKLVNGKGIAKMKRAGIKVDVGVLEYECKELNKFFMKHSVTGMPYVTFKAAQTIDGKIADVNSNSKWISSKVSRTVVHKLRAEYDAVLVGKNTIKYDNPSLTVRHVKGRNPYRIVIDKDLSLPLTMNVFSDKYKDRTIVIASNKTAKARKLKFERAGIGVLSVPLKKVNIDLRNAFKQLGSLGINSILVEGGARTFKEILDSKLVDEFIIFTAPKIMGAGISTFGEAKPVEFKNAKEVYYQFVGNDMLTNIKL